MKIILLMFFVAVVKHLNAQQTNYFEPSQPERLYFHLYTPTQPTIPIDEPVNCRILLGKDYDIQITNSWLVTNLAASVEAHGKRLIARVDIKTCQEYKYTAKFEGEVKLGRFYFPAPDLTDTNIVALPILFVLSTNADWKPGTNWWRDMYKRD